MGSQTEACFPLVGNSGLPFALEPVDTYCFNRQDWIVPENNFIFSSNMKELATKGYCKGEERFNQGLLFKREK